MKYYCMALANIMKINLGVITSQIHLYILTCPLIKIQHCNFKKSLTLAVPAFQDLEANFHKTSQLGSD